MSKGGNQSQNSIVKLKVSAFIISIFILFTSIQVMAADKLEGRAVLDAATFAPGPTSGTLLGPGPINGQDVSFMNKQPVQGFLCRA